GPRPRRAAVGAAAGRRTCAAEARLQARDRGRGKARRHRRSALHVDRTIGGSTMAIANESQNRIQDNGLREQAVGDTLAANPLGGIREQEIFESAGKLVEQTMINPALATKHYLAYLGELGRIATGGCELAPDARDKRFADPAWKDSAAYRALAQNYLA